MLPSVNKTPQRPVNTAYPKNIITLGDHIRKKRLDDGLLQKDLAKIIGTTITTIFNWENNKVEPNIQHYPKIMDYLGYCLYERAKTWGEKLRLHRIHRGLSYRKLSKMLYVDPASR